MYFFICINIKGLKGKISRTEHNSKNLNPHNPYIGVAAKQPVPGEALDPEWAVMCVPGRHPTTLNFRVVGSLPWTDMTAH